MNHKQGEHVTRAKFRVSSVQEIRQDGKVTQETIFYYPVAKSGAYPADGADEDNTYAKFSPSGSLSLTVQNPALFGKFKKDDVFYMDLHRAVPVDQEV